MSLRGRAGLLAVIAAVVVIGGGMLITGAGSSGPAPYRVDAVFDVARGIGPQQVVKIAGAQVGTVTAVRLTTDDKARVEMTVDPRFAPFRADATCQIEPEGIISENFVDCTPGDPSAPVLAADRSGTPTVPVTQTTEPISLQDLFNIWRTPVTERLTVLLDELGIGVMGRAGDVQAILGRVNPALAAAQRAIGVVNQQRAQLQQLVDAAAPVVDTLAAHDTAVTQFLRSTAALTTVTAEHRDGLAAAIAHLPALLSAARPALDELSGVEISAPPLLHELRSAAPALTQLTTQLPKFAAAAIATTHRLSPPVRQAGTLLAGSGTVATLQRLASFATDADPAGEGLDRLLVSLRDSGAIESLLRGLYNGAALTSHYDADSHVIFADLLENQCLEYATTPSAACNAHLDGTATLPSVGASHRGHRVAARTGGARGQRASGTSSRTPPAGTTTTAATPAASPAAPVTSALGHLLSYLLTR